MNAVKARKTGKPGFILVAVLLLSLLLFVVGIAFISKRTTQYSSAKQATTAAQALSLAEAGFHDAWVKVAKDVNFPPVGDRSQGIFSYSEDLTDFSGTVVGAYTVTIDTSYDTAPYNTVLITSTGTVGPRSSPTAVSSVSGEINSTGSVVNYRYLEGR